MADERNNKVNVSSDKQLTTEYVRHKRLIYVSRFLFLMYMITAIYFLLFSESMGRNANREYRYNLELFKEIKRFWMLCKSDQMWVGILNLFGNIVCFIPFGIFVPIITEHKKNTFQVTWAAFVFSGMVEISQLLFKVGIFDVDDILLNTIGGLLGYIIYKTFAFIKDLYKSASKERYKE